MEWWMWLAAGLALVVAELATPSGFFIIFFGLGALVVGVLSFAGVVPALPLQILLFTVLSVVSLVIFRERLQHRFQNPPTSNVDTLVGDLAIVQEPMMPGFVGRVEVRGSTWNARNIGSVALAIGQRARVAAIDGLTLAVVPE